MFKRFSWSPFQAISSSLPTNTLSSFLLRFDLTILFAVLNTFHFWSSLCISKSFPFYFTFAFLSFYFASRYFSFLVFSFSTVSIVYAFHFHYCRHHSTLMFLYVQLGLLSIHNSFVQPLSKCLFKCSFHIFLLAANLF